MPSTQVILEKAVLPLVMLGLVLTLAVVARNAMARSDRFQVDPGWVSVQALPAWLAEEEAERLALDIAAGLEGPVELMDREELDLWKRQALAASPWVASVTEVAGRFPYQADVRLRLRRPVMSLDDGRLVTRDGVRLSGVSASGVWPPPIAYAGQPRDEAVAECAAAAHDLLPFRDELDRLGVVLKHASLDGQGMVTFITPGGVRIQWGRSSRASRFAAYDLPAAGRVANLRDVLDHHPRLGGLSEVHLWYDRPHVVPGP
jgi:hypothetical protein